ncbi:MAG TPA: 50S ribosomal protein L10 [Candidatus Mediterraneibacter norwichensis]|nr:50S ribosomal protein L10 [Candidatus Mediterraneibacter norwichensis]
MAKVELKQPIVEAIAEEIKDAQSVVLVDYRGLTVAQDTELRKQLREAGVVYKVYKNTMMKRAFEGTEFEGLENCLEGPSAIAVSKDDATAPARILCKFAKDAPALELKGGVVEGTVYDVAGLAELSKIPSREELLSKLLGSIQSPITNFARVIKQIAEQGGGEAAADGNAEEAAEAPAEAAAETAEAPAEAAEE